jgi:(p)ppGpp synthase/HD superfamily hydrolase
MTVVAKRGWEKIFVVKFVRDYNLTLTMMALLKAKRFLEGLFRKDGRAAFVHAYKVVQILIFFGILNDIILAVGALHDLLEEISEATLDILSEIFPEEVISLVLLLTKTKDLSLATYFLRISSHPLAVLIKLADRLHNLRNMTKNLGKYSWASPEKLREQIDETNLYVLRLANQAIMHEERYPTGCPQKYFSVMLKMTKMLEGEVHLAEVILTELAI